MIHATNKNKGFTFVEIIVAVTILGILAAFTVSIVSPKQKNAQAEDAVARVNLEKAALAISSYVESEGVYPTQEDIDLLPNSPLGKYLLTWPEGLTYTYYMGGDNYTLSVPLKSQSTHLVYSNKSDSIGECTNPLDANTCTSVTFDNSPGVETIGETTVPVACDDVSCNTICISQGDDYGTCVNGECSCMHRDTSVSSINVTPSATTIAINQPITLVVEAVYSDASKKIVTSGATWTQTPSRGVISAGLASTTITPTSVGTFVLTAFYTEKNITVSKSVTITVTNPVTSISLSKTSFKMYHSSTENLVATATYTNGNTANITNMATWTSSNPTVLTVVNGIVSSKAAGISTVTASYQGKTSSVTITVVGVSSISVTPARPSLAVGGSVQMVSTANYSDGTKTVVTTLSTWTSSLTSVANVNTAGKVSALASGSTTVSAKYLTFTGSTTVTVTSSSVPGDTACTQDTDCSSFGASCASTCATCNIFMSTCECATTCSY